MTRRLSSPSNVTPRGVVKLEKTTFAFSPARTVTGDLKDIPKGWKVVVCEITTGNRRLKAMSRMGGRTLSRILGGKANPSCTIRGIGEHRVSASAGFEGEGPECDGNGSAP